MSAHFQPPASKQASHEQVRKRFPALRDGYILVTGAGDPRKNHRGLLDAYSRLPRTMREDHQLAVVGRLSRDELRALRLLAAGLRVLDQVVFTDYVVDDELLLRNRLGPEGAPSFVERCESQYGHLAAAQLEQGTDRTIEDLDRLGILLCRELIELSPATIVQSKYGESSSTAAECLSRGVPTFATEIGAIRELPDGCVHLHPRAGTPDDLASEVSSLLADRRRLAKMAEAGRTCASANTVERFAELVWERVFSQVVILSQCVPISRSPRRPTCDLAFRFGSSS